MSPPCGARRRAAVRSAPRRMEVRYMSIRGIDSQMMINRSPEMAKDTSDHMKRPEVTQDYQAIHSKLNEAVEQKRVQNTSESEMEMIRADKDGGNKGGKGGQKGQSDSNEDDADNNPGPGFIVAPGNHRIDIKV